MNIQHRTGLRVMLWAGRIFALLVFIFWGAFFVEHLMQCFIGPFPKTPPPKVWLGQALHGAMLASLLVSLRWALPGTLLLACSAVAFFGTHAGDRFPVFFAITVAPALLLVFCWWRFRLVSVPREQNLGS